MLAPAFFNIGKYQKHTEDRRENITLKKIKKRKKIKKNCFLLCKLCFDRFFLASLISLMSIVRVGFEYSMSMSPTLSKMEKKGPCEKKHQKNSLERDKFTRGGEEYGELVKREECEKNIL